MKRIICLFLIFIMLCSFAFGEDRMSGISDARDNLTALTQEEKAILEELFIIVQSIKEMEAVQGETEIEIEKLRADIKNMEEIISEQEEKYNHNLNLMEEILKNYQKNGATSYLNLILSSDSLSTLLKRINIIRDISRNTNALLEELEATKIKVMEDKEKVSSTLKLVEERQKELEQALLKSNTLKNELELNLASLQDDKAKYEKYLSNLETTWQEIKPLFSDTINMLVKTIEEGNVPDDTILLSSISLSGITGSISQEKFDNILETLDFPTKVGIELSEDKIELCLPEIDIYMEGTLEIMENKQSLIFNMNEGSYMGMKLEKSAMEELFSFGYLEFNFKNMLNKSTIKSIKLNDDGLELKINPVLF